MPVERLRRRLRDWQRGGHCLGAVTLCDGLVSSISNTVGGWARRSKAAASGRTASITTRVSGRAVRGSSVYTKAGLSPTASPASHVGLVIERPEGSPEKGLVQGCSREGEKRPNPEMSSLEWVAVESGSGSGFGDRIGGEIVGTSSPKYNLTQGYTAAH